MSVRLLQEVSALTNQTLEAALDAPIITVREAETSAIVRDGQTIVIGGLISDTQNRVETGVPVLKDIPCSDWYSRVPTTGIPAPSSPSS